MLQQEWAIQDSEYQTVAKNNILVYLYNLLFNKTKVPSKQIYWQMYMMKYNIVNGYQKQSKWLQLRKH